MAFEGDVRNIYEEVANESIEFDMAELGARLEERLRNKVHQSTFQDRLFEMKWEERN